MAKSPLLNMCILNIFHTVACMFTLLMVYFDKHKFLILKKTNLAFFLFMGSVLSSLRNIGLHLSHENILKFVFITFYCFYLLRLEL